MAANSGPTPKPTDTQNSSFIEARDVRSVAGFSHSAPAISDNDNESRRSQGDPVHSSEIRSDWAPFGTVQIRFTYGAHPRRYMACFSIAEPLPRRFVVTPLSLVALNTTRNILWGHPEHGVPIEKRPETFSGAGIAAAQWVEDFLAR